MKPKKPKPTYLHSAETRRVLRMVARQYGGWTADILHDEANRRVTTKKKGKR